MTIDGVSGRTSYIGSSLLNLKSQLDDLSTQLASGKKTNTYSGLGLDSAFATGLRAQLSNLTSYGDTATNVTTRINVANLSLQGLIDARGEVQSAATGSSQALQTTDVPGKGQTAGQVTAYSSFTQAISLLNTQSGDRYLFSGRATDTPATASADTILNGSGTQAGLKQVISERLAADQGTNYNGRLVSSASGSAVSLSEDVTGSPFGLKLSSISSSLTGSTVTQPPSPAPVAPASPSSESVDLGSTNPSEGDQINFTFTLPDGTSESIKLTATTTSPAPAGSFTIGADTTATAANLKSALDTGIQNLSQGALVAASAVQAGDNFFDDPPQRVSGTPLATATALVNGTSANTVSWYTGEKAQSASDSARGTAVAQVDSSVTVQYGARANEDAIRSELQNIAVYAAVTTNINDPNANAQTTALTSRINANLATQPNTPSVEDIQAQFAGALASTKSATTRQTQASSMAETMLDSIQGINDDEVAAKIMALQTSLQASYQVTSSLYQLSLTKFLPVG